MVRDQLRAEGDLRGKTVGLQNRGDTNELGLRLLLKQYGVDPRQVQMLALGVGNQRAIGLATGQLDAGAVQSLEAVQIQEAVPGAHQITNLRDSVRLLYHGVVVSNRELHEHTDRVERFLRASVKGREYHKAFRDETIDIISAHNGADRAANALDYDGLRPALTDDGTMPADVLQADAAVRAELLGVSNPPPLDQVYDYRLVRRIYEQLRASGWQPAR